MEKRKKKGLLLFVLAVAFVTVAFLKLTADPNVEGWREFKGNIKGAHPLIENMQIDSVTPVSLFVSFYVNRDFRVEEVIPAFEDAKEYVTSSAVLSDLQTLHKKRFKYPFDDLTIEFLYIDKANDRVSVCLFSSPVYNDGHLGAWRVEQNDVALGTYTPDGIIARSSPQTKDGM